MEAFDLAAARRASEEGRLLGWLDALLRREPGVNRNLAAIVRGHDPLFVGPLRVPLDDLVQEAGPGPGFRWPKEPARWEAEVAAIAAFEPEALPPILFRDTAGERHLSDGNHRLDAWRRRGHAHVWAIAWHDRDPRFVGAWSPFLPERTPRIEPVLPERALALLPPDGAATVVRAALVGERVVGAARLSRESDGLRLALAVDPEWRGLRLGARLLHHLRSDLDGHVVRCRAHPHLARFFGEFGFLPTETLAEGDLLLRRGA